jgi:hypothetical protein
MNSWLRNDRDAALKWFQQVPPGELRDQTISNFSYNMAEDEPALAMRWVLSMNNDGNRQNAIVNTYSNWKRNDPEGAQRWAKTTPLAPEVRKRIDAMDARNK